MATGDWKTFYAYYGTDKYKYVVDGVPSYWLHPAGLDANVESPLVYLLHCTFGHHGIFSLSPMFLLSARRLGRARPVAAIPPARLALAVGRPHRDRARLLSDADTELQLRRQHGRPALDLLADPAVARVAASPRSMRARAAKPLQILAGVLLGRHDFFELVSDRESLAATRGSFGLMERWGWIDYRHRPEEFNRPVTTFFPLLPPDASAHEWIEFESADPTGQPTRLRLADQGTVTKAAAHYAKSQPSGNAVRIPSGPTFSRSTRPISSGRFAGQVPRLAPVNASGTRQESESFLKGSHRHERIAEEPFVI